MCTFLAEIISIPVILKNVITRQGDTGVKCGRQSPKSAAGGRNIDSCGAVGVARAVVANSLWRYIVVFDLKDVPVSGTEKALLLDASANGWWQLESFDEVIVATHLAEVPAALQRVQSRQAQTGLTAMGFVSYEASPAFDSALAVQTPTGPLPLLWFALGKARFIEESELPENTQEYELGPWHAEVDEGTYVSDIHTIKAALAAGETYQINYTYRQRSAFQGQAEALFGALHQVQKGRYAGFLETQDWALCSASPELFFTREGRTLHSKPMKGTAARGRTLEEDQNARRALRESEKDRAENLMIVDMVRNDMGRIADPGSVHVPEQFAVEVYPRVLQMTSTVACQSDADLYEIFCALFPCASITGAPKVQSMNLIAQLEKSPRGAYTGALGFILPDGRAQFNVAIRSIEVDKIYGQALFGVGSGIVWDSVAAAEYAECGVKANILQRQVAQPVLLETLRWDPLDGYALLAEHLDRLEQSCQYLVYPMSREKLHAALQQHADALQAPAKVRLLLSANGSYEIESQPLGSLPPKPRVGFAREPVQRSNRWLYHKTTQRAVYQQALASRPDCDDVLLWNEAGEVTEASASNVVIELAGELLTPPIESGLLPGTLRQKLLRDKKIREQVLTKDDIQKAEKVWLINSVRGWREACCRFG